MLSLKTQYIKTIQLNIFLFAILGILIGCNSKNTIIEVSQKDSVESIVSKPELPKTYLFENCNCEENPELKDIISCEETVFSNGAKIYRQFNCDSSWIVFENKNLKRNIQSLEKELIELTHRLGYVEWDEYEESILIANRLWSGSSAPYEYHLIDKETGKEIINLGQAIYLNEEHLNPYFISLDSNNSKIKIYNINTRKFAEIPFNMNKIDSTHKLGGFLQFPEELFGPGEIKNNIFKIKYSYRLVGNDELLTEKIKIDLNKVEFN